MKKTIFSILMIAFVAVFSSCGSKGGSNAAENTEPESLSVDQVLASPDEYVGDTITVEGVCSHLCAHGAMKAFIAGSSDTVMLRCEANPHIGEPFPVRLVRRPVQIKGILAEQRLDSAAVDNMEVQYKEALAKAEAEGKNASEAGHEGGACAAERTAQGQANITDFEARMEDYRQKIAARQQKEGKPYLSFYYLEATSYDLLPE